MAHSVAFPTAIGNSPRTTIPRGLVVCMLSQSIFVAEGAIMGMRLIAAVACLPIVLLVLPPGPGLAQQSLDAAVAEPPKSPPSARYDSTDQYEVQRIEGWRVLVNRQLPGRAPSLSSDTLKVLAIQLYHITRKVPAGPLTKLRKITIWVELAEPHHPCMAYHPNAGWLRDHGMNPEKAGCVEIANAKNFLTWTLDQPWMVLHELAHGYHDRFLGGYDNPEIRAEYNRAMKAKLYDGVPRINGKTERAYAATNPMEYFAENTEALFGTNDFYPFVRSELKHHDPQMCQLLEKLWGGLQTKP